MDTLTAPITHRHAAAIMGMDMSSLSDPLNGG